MHKIDYEKLISIKRDVGWFVKKEGDSIQGHNGQGYVLVCRKKAQKRIGLIALLQFWNAMENTAIDLRETAVGSLK